jgi:hypothetical protein
MCAAGTSLCQHKNSARQAWVGAPGIRGKKLHGKSFLTIITDTRLSFVKLRCLPERKASIMPPPKFTPRAEYRQQQAQRVSESPTLSELFPELKTLTVESAYFNPDGGTRNREIKFTPNLEHARSVFRVECVNQECVGGDFDLSDVLAHAVAERQTKVTGEMPCQGWRSKTTIGQVHCHDILRYELTLGYHAAANRVTPELQAAER